MIYTEAKSLFDAVPPKLEDHEEEIIYVHPALPDISCNQLGVLYFDEDKYVLLENVNGSYLRSKSNKGDKKSYGTKLRILWECYGGKLYGKTHSPHIYQINANIYDCTRENLLLATEADKKTQAELNLRKKVFVNESILRLIEIEKKWTPLGYSPEELWTLMALPFWLVGARRRHSGEKEVKFKKRRKKIKKIFE